MKARISVVVLAVVIALSCHEVKPQDTTSYGGFDLVDKTGNIRKPTGYRDHYQILGTFTVFNAIPMMGISARKKGGLNFLSIQTCIPYVTFYEDGRL